MADEVPLWERLLEAVPGLTPDQRERAKKLLIREYPCQYKRAAVLVRTNDARRLVMMLLGHPWTLLDELWMLLGISDQPQEDPTPEGPSYNMPTAEAPQSNSGAHLRRRKVHSGMMEVS
ncbi:hypothetical protein Vafri_4509 [Volvox africanus]|uniref:Uncharacterized protein n=1 Tax=Volvox africanus TaxID=51714 RepID=A0A8J4EV18_9CHLO|nr:hypothetical protein Vafri_4514 [Volvox africanus]GIL47877.1 hypothetical protein Vafri_4509 [Volvox africanus]